MMSGVNSFKTFFVKLETCDRLPERAKRILNSLVRFYDELKYSKKIKINLKKFNK